MEIQFVENGPIDSEGLIAVFRSVGWNKNSEDIVAAFKKSHYITAVHQGQVIGFARAISDGLYYTGIYDVVVVPSMQRRGIATKMVKRLVELYRHTYIFLSYTEGNRDVYAKCGFRELPTAMWIEKGSIS